MATKLVSIAAPADKVKLKGFRENKVLFEAETVTNVKTNDSVTVADPIPPDQAPASHKGLAEFKSHGTIRVQLLGRRGEVNGLILQNGTIVLFGPHLPNELGAQIDVGKRIDVSGYGTQTTYGQSLNAVTITNF